MTIISGADGSTRASFSLGNRLRRAVWGGVYLLLFRPSPRVLHVWRSFLLRLFGAQIGPHVHVYPSVRIWAPWNLEIAGHVGVGDHAILYSMAPIRIGLHATVSQGAHLCAGSHDIDSDNFQLVAAPIEVGAYAWICAEAFIGMGVRIPPGAVVGARAVVVKDLESEWSVYGGNPARRIRSRRVRSGARR